VRAPELPVTNPSPHPSTENSLAYYLRKKINTTHQIKLNVWF